MFFKIGLIKWDWHDNVVLSLTLMDEILSIESFGTNFSQFTTAISSKEITSSLSITNPQAKLEGSKLY